MLVAVFLLIPLFLYVKVRKCFVRLIMFVFVRCKCSLNFSLLSMVTPRYLTLVVGLVMCPSKIIVGFY